MTNCDEDDALGPAIDRVDDPVVADPEPPEATERRVLRGYEGYAGFRPGFQRWSFRQTLRWTAGSRNRRNSRENVSVTNSSYGVAVRPSATEVRVTTQELGLRQDPSVADVLKPPAYRFQLRAVGEGVHRLKEALPQRPRNLHDILGGARHGRHMHSLELEGAVGGRAGYQLSLERGPKVKTPENACAEPLRFTVPDPRTDRTIVRTEGSTTSR